MVNKKDRRPATGPTQPSIGGAPQGGDYPGPGQESIVKLAAQAGHDFNNLLTTILGFSELLLDHLPEGDPGYLYVEGIVKTVGQASALAEQLLALGRRQLSMPQAAAFPALTGDVDNSNVRARVPAQPDMLSGERLRRPQVRETILLVEDDGDIRALFRTALEGQGYAIIAARDGEEALRLGVDHPDVIHLLVTDLVMPQMTGKELAEHLLRLRPELKVLYMSGYGDSAVADRRTLGPSACFLSKPFSLKVLMQKVRELLDAPPFKP